MRFVLVDFENVQPSGLGTLARGKDHVRVFVGASQSKIPFETARALQALGSDAEYVQSEGSGRNALDFHIAFYLGRLAVEHPKGEFVIVSKDTGFDPLVRHMNAQGVSCRRVVSISTAPVAEGAKPAKAKTKKAKPAVAAAPAIDESIVKNSAERLLGMRAARPRTLKTLTSSLKAWHKLDDTALEALLKALAAGGTVKIDGKKKISYRFD